MARTVNAGDGLQQKTDDSRLRVKKSTPRLAFMNESEFSFINVFWQSTQSVVKYSRLNKDSG